MTRAWKPMPSASAMAAHVPPRSTTTRIITGVGAQLAHHLGRLQRRGAPGHRVLGDDHPVARLEGAGQASGHAVVLGLLADGERAQVATSGGGHRGDAVGHRVGARA